MLEEKDQGADQILIYTGKQKLSLMNLMDNLTNGSEKILIIIE